MGRHAPRSLGLAVRQPGIRISRSGGADRRSRHPGDGSFFDAVAAGIATGNIRLTNDLVQQTMSPDFEWIRQEFGFPGDDHVVVRVLFVVVRCGRCDQPGGLRAVRHQHPGRNGGRV